jgi:phosphoribosylanthranilate isomerase
MTRIKICGITNIVDALTALKLGVDAIGFVFAPGPRSISPEQAREISKAVLPYVSKVGVFVDEPVDTINEISEFCGLDTIQLHGEYTSIDESRFVRSVVRTFRVEDESILGEIRKANLKYFLMDTCDQIHAGGTGRSFNWKIAREAKKYGDVILAGGLNHENITEALMSVSPYAIDVSSGVEKSPGIKDPEKMRLLVNEVKNWDIQAN